MRTVLALALAATVAACAAPSQPNLDAARDACRGGSAGACNALPALQRQVNLELEAQQAQANAAAAAMLTGLAAASAGFNAGYYSRQPVVVVCRWGC